MTVMKTSVTRKKEKRGPHRCRNEDLSNSRDRPQASEAPETEI